MQFDADTVGTASMAADAEMCMLAADTMEALGIERGDYVVKVNNRKVLDGIIKAFGISADRQLLVMRAIDKMDRLGYPGVSALLGEGRKDESGDFTKGAGLDSATIQRLLTLLFSKTQGYLTLDQFAHRPVGDMARIDNHKLTDNYGTLAHWASYSGGNETALTGIAELQDFVISCEAAGYGSNRILVDPSVVRGLEYYTGPVYEVELLIETPDDKGRPVRFGSVGGGGRYDGLVSRFRGQPVPATGFSIGVSRLQAALTALGKLGTAPPAGPVVMTVMDKGAERMADYQRLVAKLRAEGIAAEVYLGSPNSNLQAQLKYADRRRAPIALIQGSNEKAQGHVIVKDLILGAELAGLSADREAHLKKQAEAQFAVSEDGLTDAVRQLLKRHKLS
jgi:histidyl-tRNA synthetase